MLASVAGAVVLVPGAVHGAVAPVPVGLVVTGQIGLDTGAQLTVPPVGVAATPPQVADSIAAAEPDVMSCTDAVTL